MKEIKEHESHEGIEHIGEIEEVKYHAWLLCKDDISPKDIFNSYRQNESNPLMDQEIVSPEMVNLRTLVAKYCTIDCYLVYIVQ